MCGRLPFLFNMKAIQIQHFRKDPSNLKLIECDVPRPKMGEVLIKVEAFGLNFADIMARKGKYRDAPPLPFIPGYDVVGHIVEINDESSNLHIGDRVCALTRFGGYAEYACADARAVQKIDEDIPVTAALSLATQGATAWYCVEESTSLLPNSQVLVTAAAGGVGSLIVQMCAHKNCQVWGIVGSEEKKDLIKTLGATYAINRNNGDVFTQIQRILPGTKFDAFYDSAGGSYTRKGIKTLAPGGVYVGYGASQNSQINNPLSFIKFALSFGIYHPAPFIMNSQGIRGVNMLRLADYKPNVIKKCMESIFELHAHNIIKPLAGKSFAVSDIFEAHQQMEAGKIPGKIAIVW